MRTSIILNEAVFAKEGGEFMPIRLPHTWNAADGQDGGADYWRGKGIYQIPLPSHTPEKCQYVEFQGANHIAEVRLNGQTLGSHEGGFSTFRFELSGLLNEKNNILTVIVSNEKSHVYPQNADFIFFGGLYRKVLFIETEREHFDLMKTGTDGVFVTPYATGNTRLDIFPVNAEGCMVKIALTNREGKVVSKQEMEAQEHVISHQVVEKPHLWNGVADPYCYQAEVSLWKKNILLDQVDIEFGYRSFRVDAGNGFYLNGKHMPLHGVCRHQDRQDMGWAISEKEHEEDLSLIQEMGANSIRLAHYQHDRYFYHLCNQAGMVVWAEIPFITEFNPDPKAKENTLSQMRELIAQRYNEPCICFWSIGNETTMLGESEGLYRNLCELNALVKKMDPSRLTTIAHGSMNSEAEYIHEYNHITDTVGYNVYLGWYNGDIRDNGAWADRFHKTNPDLCLALTEYGAESVLQWHSADPENHDYSEEYAMKYHEEMLKVFEERPYIWGTFLWNMFDFAADARDEGGVKGRNNKGLVTYDRKICKDAYFIYQAYWTEKPMIHLCGERFVNRAPDERDITAYTNCSEVTLYLNGKVHAVLKAEHRKIVFKNVPLTDGENRLFAVSGETISNEIILVGTEHHDCRYDLPEDGREAGNWFEERKPLPHPEGFYSIRDFVCDLRKNPKTATIMGDAADRMIENEVIGWGYADPEARKEFLKVMGDYFETYQLSSLFRTSGKVLPKDYKYELNAKLNKISKTK